MIGMTLLGNRALTVNEARRPDGRLSHTAPPYYTTGKMGLEGETLGLDLYRRSGEEDRDIS